MLSNLVGLQGFLWDIGDGYFCLVLMDQVGLVRLEGLGIAKGAGEGAGLL